MGVIQRMFTPTKKKYRKILNKLLAVFLGIPLLRAYQLEVLKHRRLKARASTVVAKKNQTIRDLMAGIRSVSDTIDRLQKQVKTIEELKASSKRVGKDRYIALAETVKEFHKGD